LGEGAKGLYEFYPSRDLLEDEFEKLMEIQACFHPAILNADTIAALQRAIFWQRPLAPVEVGPCTLEPTEKRLPKALPSVEARAIYEMLNQLRYGEGLVIKTPLTRDQRDHIASTLLQGKNFTFDKLRAVLKLPGEARFSLEDGGKKDLKDFASKSAAAMRKRFGEHWLELPLRDKDEVIKRIINEEDEDALTAWLQSAHELDEDAAKSVAAWSPPEGTSRLGATANEAVLSELIDGVSDDGGLLTYDKAVKSAGEKLGRNWHHSDFRDGEIHLRLPYYGKVLERHVAFASRDPKDGDEKRFGKLANPTVHIGLNQLRRLVNRLVGCYGEPAQIVVELARELKLSKQQKEEERKRNVDNRKANDLRRIELEKLGQADTADNRLRLRLFEEQQRANGGIALCPYSLQPISIATLFSSEVDIDHILPYSKTLDDTIANRLICYRATNRVKRNCSPFEAFGDTLQWTDIVAHAANLPANKRWRFAPDAMDRFNRVERDFLARQINETRYLSRMARFYLAAACGLDNVYVTTGQLTAMLRARWGLNSILQGA
jgi:CRISPR-associated endonuclease Csn1